jgi:hypothetical protein
MAAAALRRACWLGSLYVSMCALAWGCQSYSSGVTTTDASTRLSKLVNLYKAYVERNQKGPADKAALVEFGQKLTPQERDEYMIGDDLETIFISPRDNQPFEITYGLTLAAGGPTQALAWEATGQEGRRYTALTMGYVEEYSEETLQEYKR